MKKLITPLVIISIVYLTGTVHAQTMLGFIGGLNLANITVEPDDGDFDFDTRSGFGLGGILDMSFNESIGLRIEPMYLQKGTETNMDGIDVQVKADYIEIPILLRYTVESKTVKPFFMVGPTIGFNVSAKTKASFMGQSQEEDMKDEIKNFDFGIAFGMGLHIPYGNNVIFFEGRYTLGLANINDDPQDAATQVKTNGIQLFAGMTFPIGSD